MQNRNQKNNDNALEQALSRLYSADVPAAFDIAWQASVRREESLQMMNKPKKNPFPRIVAPALAALVLVTGSLWAGTLPLNASMGIADSPNIQELQERGTSYGMAGMDKEAAQPMAMDVSMNSLAGTDGAGAAAKRSMGANDPSHGVQTVADTGNISDVAATGQKLVRTADLTIRTTAFDADAKSVRELVTQLGGYVENLYQYGDLQNGQMRSVSLSMRVPSDKLDGFLSGVSGIGRVTNRSESSADLTVEYADNESRLKTLRDKQQRLTELMKSVVNVADIVEIENAMADTQYQLDSYETSQRSIDRRVGMSAVSVTVQEETPAQSAAAEDKSLSARLPAALKASVQWIGDFLRNMLVFIVMILPVLVPVAVIGLGVWVIVRNRRKKAGKEATKE